MSIAALVLGIISLLTSWSWAGFAGILAIIFGAVGAHSGKNRGCGIAGVVLGVLSVFGSIISLAVCGGVTGIMASCL